MVLCAAMAALTASAPVPGSGAGPSPSATTVEAGAIRLPVTTAPGEARALLDDETRWSRLAGTPLRLSRTPPLYEGDPLDDGHRPETLVTVVRAGDGLVVRLAWSDPTESRPEPPRSLPDAGEAPIYKEHSRDVERFADAACVMTTRGGGPADPYPSLMMGGPGAPVDLYYWHLVRGFEKLGAHGRSTTGRTGEPSSGSARRTAGGWEVRFLLPALPAGTPVAFAVWDGDSEHRDGLKYFSVWCEVGS
jgi:hypothetical protein